MSKNVENKQLNKTKKAYHQPKLTSLGSVRGLTLKLGSQTDAADPANPTFT